MTQQENDKKDKDLSHVSDVYQNIKVPMFAKMNELNYPGTNLKNRVNPNSERRSASAGRTDFLETVAKQKVPGHGNRPTSQFLNPEAVLFRDKSQT